jgi:integrase
MGRRKSPGLKKRGRNWWIDKRIKGYGRVAESCGTTNLAEAEQYLAFRLNEIRNAMVYGIRPTRTFQEAAIKFLEDNQRKKLLERYVYALDRVMPHIGHLRLDRIHNGTLSSYRRARRADGVSAGTINKELSCVRRILNLAARVWRHDNGMSWLDAPPLIEMEQGPRRRPYPLSWEEQDRLFRELPAHLQRIALYKVNTGCRTQEVLQLRWDWEVRVPELKSSVFILPNVDEFQTKNGQERVVVLNSIARRVTCEGSGRSTAGSCSRSSAHIRPSIEGGRRELRRSSGPARSQVRSDHDALLGAGHFAPDRGNRKCLHAARQHSLAHFSHKSHTIE